MTDSDRALLRTPLLSFERRPVRMQWLALLMAAVWAVASQGAWAQSMPNLLGLTPEQLEALQRGETPETQGGLEPRERRLQAPERLEPVPAEPTRLEEILSQRAGQPLRQFGYEMLEGAESLRFAQTGAIQDSYVLGPGDEVIVTLRGQENSRSRVIVDREGRVLLPRLNPIPAGGRTFGEFREDALTRLREAYVSTDAFVSIGQVRQVSVLVTGEVARPGAVALTGFSTPVDALLLAGGVKRSGSLRNVRVVRGTQEITYDLYSVLLGAGAPPQLSLTEGDRIVVGSLGRVVGLGGWVRRPGIYELPPGETAMPLAAALDLAGGLEVRGAYRFQILTVRPDGRQEVVEVSQADARTLRDSDVVLAEPAVEQVVGQASLLGNVPIPGRYAIARTQTLKTLLATPGTLGRSPYMLLGVVSRRDPQSLIRQPIGFSPVNVVQGRQDLNLRDDDIVRVFSTSEARALIEAVDRARMQSDVLDGLERERRLAQIGGTGAASQASGIVDAAGAPALSEAERRAALIGDTGTIATEPGAGGESPGEAAGLTEAERARLRAERLRAAYTERLSPKGPAPGAELASIPGIADQLGLDPIVLLQFLSDNTAQIAGAVRGPGLFLVAEGTTLEHLVAAAGGTQGWADRSNIEVTSTVVEPATGRAETRRVSLALSEAEFGRQPVRARDVVRFQQVFTELTEGEIRIEGQVRSPGSYRFLRGDRLSTILARAGGLTENAYPYGAVFLRQSAARLEREGNARAAQEIEAQIVSAFAETELGAEAGPFLREMVNQLRSAPALGRISVEADPTSLAGKPEHDIVLEPGDVLFMPSRPSTVQVSGQVLKPGAYQFKSGEDADYYIALAGGAARSADDSYAFVVFPDGTARRLDDSWFRFERRSIPPGSVIVVPRDLAPFNLRRFMLDFAQIVQSLAVSAASLAVLNNNN